MKIFFSFRSKLILAISVLMAVIFLVIGYLFVNEKRVELADDIYVNVRSFAELTAPKVAEMTDLYLKEEGFVYFNREIQGLLKQNGNVSEISVISYKGEVLYDSEKFENGQGSSDGQMEKLKTLGEGGEVGAVIADGEEVGSDVSDGVGGASGVILPGIEQIKSKNQSFSVLGGSGSAAGSASSSGLEAGPQNEGGYALYYLKKNSSGQYSFVDKDEKPVTGPKIGFEISYFVQPAGDKYSVVYYVSYANMAERIAEMKNRIIATAVLGFMLGILLAMFMGARVIKPVKKLVDGASEVAKGNFKYQVEIKSHDELGFLGGAFNKMAQDLGASVEARVYKERVGHELQLAREIQDKIIPKVLPNIPGLDVAASIIPATEVGGDVYDFIPVDENETLIYLGDVTGHGVQSSMISAVANSLFYSYAGLKDLKGILQNVNAVLKKKMMSTMFMTLCMAKWDASSGVLSYVNAGHEPILHYSAQGGTVTAMEGGGIAVGMVADISAQLKEVDIPMAVSDVVVLYSDGIIEAWNASQETYGLERLKEIIKNSSNSSTLRTAKEIKDAILADVRKFTAGYEQKDDVTLVVGKRI